jgi:hypothetical protein
MALAAFLLPFMSHEFTLVYPYLIIVRNCILFSFVDSLLIEIMLAWFLVVNCLLNYTSRGDLSTIGHLSEHLPPQHDHRISTTDKASFLLSDLA